MSLSLRRATLQLEIAQEIVRELQSNINRLLAVHRSEYLSTTYTVDYADRLDALSAALVAAEKTSEALK